jgi:alpha-L-fucosidase
MAANQYWTNPRRRPETVRGLNGRSSGSATLIFAAALALLVLPWISPAGGEPVSPPQPYGPLPTARQLRWHEMEFYGFVHFTVNTFTDKEWGYGDEGEATFNPTDFDPDQIAATAKDAGMKGLILTAKHHDGFCLWPSQFTEHSVKNSPWQNGKGDVVRDLSKACRRHGLRFGVYLSPWDRNRKDYATPEYITYYRNQLRELLTHYGDIFTVWFDGANGGDGYYGGARETRKIDARTYYDWDNTRRLVRELMPMAVMFSDAGPDFRWVGNENGIAGDPCWETLNSAGRYPGGPSEGLTSGERPGTDWIPPECDVSIRPGWFYHAKEDSRVKSPAQLLDIYYKSVGRGACLNLNIPPDRRGQIHDEDTRSLHEFHRILEQTFDHNLAAKAILKASNVRGQSKAFAPENLLHKSPTKYWSTDDNVTTPDLVLEFSHPVTFNVVSLREYLPLGQRVEAFAVEQWQNGNWVEFAKGTSIGNRRLVRFDNVTTDKVRLRVTKAPVCPALSEFGLFATPAANR